MNIEILGKVIDPTYHIFKVKITNNTNEIIQYDASLFEASCCIPVREVDEYFNYKEEKQLKSGELQKKESVKGFIAFRSREFILFPDIFYNGEKITYGIVAIEKKNKKEKKEKNEKNKGKDFLEKMRLKNGTD